MQRRIFQFIDSRFLKKSWDSKWWATNIQKTSNLQGKAEDPISLAWNILVRIGTSSWKSLGSCNSKNKSLGGLPKHRHLLNLHVCLKYSIKRINKKTKTPKINYSFSHNHGRGKLLETPINHHLRIWRLMPREKKSRPEIKRTSEAVWAPVLFGDGKNWSIFLVGNGNCISIRRASKIWCLKNLLKKLVNSNSLFVRKNSKVDLLLEVFFLGFHEWTKNPSFMSRQTDSWCSIFFWDGIDRKYEIHSPKLT